MQGSINVWRSQRIQVSYSRMEEKINAAFYGIGDFSRKGEGFYPIFSLRKDKPHLIEELRTIMSALNVAWTEHDLPDDGGPDIGFMLPRARWRDISANEVGRSQELKARMHVWGTRPKLTPLPRNLFLRPECRIDPIAIVEKFIGPPDILPGGWGEKPNETTYGWSVGFAASTFAQKSFCAAGNSAELYFPAS